MENTPNSMWTTGYINGYKVSFTVDLANVDAFKSSLNAIADVLAALAGVGMTPTLGDGEASDLIAECDTVVRRYYFDKKRQEAIPLIDLYPAWENGFGKFKFTSIYINNDEDRAAFEQATGLRVDNLPVYEAQAALMRDSDRPHKYEVKAPKSFRVAKAENGEKEFNGTTQMTYRFDRFVDLPPVASNGNGSTPTGNSEPAEAEDTSTVTLKAGIYVKEDNNKRWYYVKSVDDVKYWTTDADLLNEFASNPTGLAGNSTHPITGLAGAVAHVSGERVVKIDIPF